MRLSLPRPAAPLRRDERGASAIEFALFAPILAMLVMGITDISMGYSRKLTLEAAAYRTLERVEVGTVQTDYSSLRPEAASAAGVPVENVTVDTWLECDNTRQADFNGNCNSGQMIARYVQINIRATFTPSFDYGPLAGRFRSSNGNVPLTASASLRIQ